MRCSAKVNLYLGVTGKRSDGFHDIVTLFQPVSLYDRLHLARTADGIELEGDDPSIPWDGTNLCHRAAGAFFRSSGAPGGVRIEVSKSIPHGAGLGGGSADAAAVLTGLNALFGHPLSGPELERIGLDAGSDVPFFIRGTPAVGRGRGEILDETGGLRNGWIVIVKPPFTVPTGWAYENLKIMLTSKSQEDRLNYLLKGLERFPECHLITHNSFEAVVVERYPEIGRLLESLRNEKPELTSLSGSGAACFALFSDRKRAEEVAGAFEGKGFFSVLTQPVYHALELLHWE